MKLHVEDLTDKLSLIEFPSRGELAYSLVRIQERFESPRFIGRTFVLGEFKMWYTANSPRGRKTGRFTYVTDWQAFNLPARAFRPFYEGEFDPLSQQERSLLKMLRPWVDDGVYIIATWKNGSRHDLRHEVAHGLFNTNSKYRRKVLQTLGDLDTNQRKILEQYLSSRAGYHPKTFLDEMHAYLIAGHKDLAEGGVNISLFQDIIAKLMDVFDEFTDKYAGLKRFKIRK